MELTPDLNKDKTSQKKEVSAVKPADKSNICPRCKLKCDDLIKIYAFSFSSKGWPMSLLVGSVVGLVGYLLKFESEVIFGFVCVSIIPTLFAFAGKTFCPRCGNSAAKEMQDEDF